MLFSYGLGRPTRIKKNRAGLVDVCQRGADQPRKLKEMGPDGENMYQMSIGESGPQIPHHSTHQQLAHTRSTWLTLNQLTCFLLLFITFG